MTIAAPEPTVEQVIAARQVRSDQIRQAALAAVLGTWSSADLLRMGTWWAAGAAARIFAAIALAQETMAIDALEFVEDALAAQGEQVDIPTLDPLAFAGFSYDTEDLAAVLSLAPARTQVALATGTSEAEARKKGADYLTAVTLTEISDAARAAEHTATVAARPADGRSPWSYGWVRVLTPPSCSRCAILAGRFYKWNTGFARHPNCDCRHLPATVANFGSVATDPKVYFDSLTDQEKTQLFGRNVSEAIEAGADIYRVVNAATKGKVQVAGDGRRFKNRVPSPWQVIKDADGDRDEAVRLLTRFGYIRP